MEPIPYGRQTIDEDDIQAVVEVLKSPYLTQGPKIDEFEAAFSNQVSAKYSIAICNATQGLHIAVQALGIKAGQKVITTPLTFVADANAILYNKGVPVFCDIDPKTMLLDIDALDNLLKNSTPDEYAGVITVDFAGWPILADRVRKITKKYNLWVISDACHAPGAQFLDSEGEWHIVGSNSFSDITVFSLHPVKHIAAGEGGILTTQSDEIYKKLRLLRSHGITKVHSDFKNESHGGWYAEMQELGFNFRMTDMQSALALSQLKKLKNSVKRRQDIAQFYFDSLSGIEGLRLFKPGENVSHAYHLFVIATEQRKELYDFLKGRNIFAQVHYLPIYLNPYYEKLGYPKGLCPQAEKLYSKILSLPMYPALTHEQLSYIVDQIKSFFKK